MFDTDECVQECVKRLEEILSMHGLWSSPDTMEDQHTPVKSDAVDISQRISLMPLYDTLALCAQTIIISKV